MQSAPGRSYKFTNAIARVPGDSTASGIRALDTGNPDAVNFRAQHNAYVAALRMAGVNVTVLPQLEAFPDSVFVEDAALCLRDTAIMLRARAPTRCGESEALRPVLETAFEAVIDLPGPGGEPSREPGSEEGGYIDGGDILLSDDEVLIGLSERTDAQGIAAITPILRDHGYQVRTVATPPQILHFKTECGLIGPRAILATKQLVGTGCFADYDVIVVPTGEEAAANVIRINEYVFLGDGFPRTRVLLERAGFKVKVIAISEAAKIDGGLSCMSLRYS